MSFEHFHENKCIFRHNERGDKFYLILKGTTYVYVPKEEQVLIQEMAARESLIQDFVNAPSYEEQDLYIFDNQETC